MQPIKEFYSLASDVRPVAAPEGGVFLLSERGSQHSAAPLVGAVVTLADGTRDTAALIAALPDFAPAEVIYGLNRLTAQGVLVRHAGPLDGAQGGQGGRRTVSDVHLLSDNSAALDAMSEALHAAGRIFPAAPQIVLCADYLGAEMSRRTARDGPWLPVKLVGTRSYFGPLIGHDQGVCFDCLRRQLRRNRPVEAVMAAQSDNPINLSRPDRQPLAPTAPQTITAVIAFLAKGRSEGGTEIVEAEVAHERHHPLTCTCNRDTLPRDAPAALAGATPFGRHPGGYRCHAPGAIVARLAPLVSDLTGLISSHGPLDCGDGSASRRHVWAAAYPIMPRSRVPGLDAFHGVAMGKGLTAVQAEASTLCEAVERLSAQYRDGQEVRQARLGDLDADTVHPNAVWQFSPAQFKARAQWNAQTTDERRHVPEPLDPARSLAWVPVWSLTHGHRKWMARDLCFANAPEPRYGRFDPNGCAAGASIPEAAVQGLLELVERDSVAIWWYNRLRRPGIDPRSFGNQQLDDLSAGFEAQGWDSWLLDLTSDLGIPCLAAVARARADSRWCIGFGCHFDVPLAAERAMTELVQLFRADGRDGPPPWAPMETSDETFLFPSVQATPCDAPIGQIDTFEGLLHWAAGRLADRDIELLLLDQTHPETGLSVVKVFAPGLRHFWPRFGPGRLYDVPVTMGWGDAPLTEDALNPVHLFL